MQQLNKYCYNIAVGRAQTRIFRKFMIRTGENGYVKINHKELVSENETKEFSKDQLVDWIKKEVYPGNKSVTRIDIHNLLECSQFEQIWSTLVPRENFNGLEKIIFTNMPKVMGVPIISTLTNCNMHSLIELDLTVNASWWKDDVLF